MHAPGAALWSELRLPRRSSAPGGFGCFVLRRNLCDTRTAPFRRLPEQLGSEVLVAE